MRRMMLLTIMAGLCLACLSACRRMPITAGDADGGPPRPIRCTNWTRLASSPASDVYRAVLGFGANDVYALLSQEQGSQVLHYDGVKVTSLTKLSGAATFIWGSGPSDLYVLHGTSNYQRYSPGPLQPYVTHFDGKTWRRLTGVPHLGGYAAIWGSGPADVYVVGGSAYSPKASGTMAHFDGTGWSAVQPGLALGYYALWGSDSANIFASGCCDGKEGVVLRYDGVSWRRSFASTYLRFNAIWGAGPDDVFAVGKLGVYHYDGNAWTRQQLPWHKASIGDLLQVGGLDGRFAIAGGMQTLLQWNGRAWTLFDAAGSDFHFVYGVWGNGSTLFVAGAEYLGPGGIWRATCSPGG